MRASCHFFVIFDCLCLVSSCSNLLIPQGSTTDGSTIITYSTDNPARFGDVAHWPAKKHATGQLREIFDFDTGHRLGAIPEAAETYNVVSNTNEHQLSITETTFGGLTMLDASNGGVDFGPGHVEAVCNKTYGCLDYGAMIYVALQRAKTAKEAISVIDELMQTYVYASSGESFSIADPQEVWLMEIMSKGNFSKGAVWVCAHP
jgi:dipeptidase